MGAPFQSRRAQLWLKRWPRASDFGAMALGLDTASRRLGALLCLALGAGTCLGVAGPAFGAVAVGSYCVVGTGPTAGAATDGWVAVVTPAGAVTLLVNGAPFVNPNDCAIDANGDIVVVDKGIAGAAFDGAVYRVSTVGPTVTTVVSPVGSPMQNPSGLAVGSDQLLRGRYWRGLRPSQRGWRNLQSHSGRCCDDPRQGCAA